MEKVGGVIEDPFCPEVRRACHNLYQRQLAREGCAWDPVSDLDTTLKTMVSISGCEERFCEDVCAELRKYVATKREIRNLKEDFLCRFMKRKVAAKFMVYAADVEFFYTFIDNLQ